MCPEYDECETVEDTTYQITGTSFVFLRVGKIEGDVQRYDFWREEYGRDGWREVARVTCRGSAVFFRQQPVDGSPAEEVRCVSLSSQQDLVAFASNARALVMG